jgi:hypothetical protein
MISPHNHKEDHHMSPQQQESTETNKTGTGQRPAAEGQNFADRVGQKQRPPVPDPFGIATDAVAGVRLFESKQDRQMAIKFGDGSSEDKPSQAVIDKMKEEGFKWKSADRVWALPVRAESALGARIDAERLFQEVSQMIRQEKGIEAGKEIPF